MSCGTGVAAKSPSDGYTLHVSAAYISSPATHANLPYDPTKVFIDIAPLAQGMKKGSIRPLAITSAKRSNLMPEIPTIAETVVPAIAENLWWGVWTCAAPPASVVDKLAKDIANVLAEPDLLTQLKKRGFEPMSMSQEEFAQFVKSEMENVARTAKDAGISPKE
ncbi:MAG: hypothetical protein H8E79_06815 [Desulfobulbaceae bacterium]|uniref:Tripartite tricarboxylate transporter substrate binding protein n=1 Tax=Candidatus Desulfatifera sulfidica TaxID=2841691 RepID=A0A8J6NBD7_9BACT|nr:hypothetical protein [Candidatus Desulfatifera sulfidica]